MRYFRAVKVISDSVRVQAMLALGQPNGKAEEPWSENGDFLSGGKVHIAIAPHQYTGEFWEPMISAALAAGVEEITEAQYREVAQLPPI
jgi:hypothetical protein